MQELTTPNCTRPETVIIHDGWVYGSFHGKIARMREDGSDFEVIVDTKGETLGFDLILKEI